MKKLLLAVGILGITLSMSFYTKASILPSNLLQSALYNKNYSSNLFKGTYDQYTDNYYICDSSTSFCGISNKIFQIRYDSITDIYYLCEGNAGYCGISSALYKIKDGYICPGSNSVCNSTNSLGVPPFLIPIESIIATIDGASSATTYNSTKMNYSNGIYYICNGNVAACGITTAFMQIKYDSNNNIYNISDSAGTTYLRLKYDSNNGTYNLCNSNICGGTIGFMKIKYESSDSTYYICEGGGISCSSIFSYLAIKVDGTNYYTCGGGSVCGAGMASYQTIIDKKNNVTSNNVISNNIGTSVIVSEESWNMLSNKYDTARELIEKGNYDDAITLLNEILGYEGTIIWGDNYDLARKVLEIAKEGKEKRINNSSNNGQTNTRKQYDNKFDEMSDAIERMYDNGLTIYKNFGDFMPFQPITREQASKFYVEFAAKVLGKDRGVVYNYDMFSDIKNANPTLKDYIIYANNMGLFKGSNGKFMPFNNLTKAQAIAVIIRLVDGYQDESGLPIYDKNFKEHRLWYSRYLNNVLSYGLNSWGQYDDFASLDSTNISRGDMALLIYEMYLYITYGK